MRRRSLWYFVKNVIAATCICASSQALFAANFTLPAQGNALIGEINYISTNHGDTPASIASRYNIGQNVIISANPGVKENYAMPGGRYLKIPTRFILPPLPHKGIIVNLPEMRLYYYPGNGGEVMTFPIGIGRIGKTIPIENTSIARKVVNPTWTPPEDIREFNRQQGIELPDVMPPGPDNPLGPYAIYLRIPTFLIHSTIFPESIGRRASFGCIRMNETDIKQFFPIVTAGIPVIILDMPNKVGWDSGHLFLEAHPPLEERESSSSLTSIVSEIQRALPADKVTLINWQLVSYLSSQPDGVPHDIGFNIN